MMHALSCFRTIALRSRDSPSEVRASRPSQGRYRSALLRTRCPESIPRGVHFQNLLVRLSEPFGTPPVEPPPCFAAIPGGRER